MNSVPCIFVFPSVEQAPEMSNDNRVGNKKKALLHPGRLIRGIWRICETVPVTAKDSASDVAPSFAH